MQKKIKNDLVYILVSFPLPIHPEILSLFDEQIPKKFIKEKSSIFTIVELQAYLNSNKITDILYVGRHINDCIKNSMID